MSLLLISAAALVLSCGLSATPDGEAAPAGSVVAMNAPIPANLAESLASGSPPPKSMIFVGESQVEPEWIVGLKSDPTKGVQISRLSRDLFGLKVKIGWVLKGSDGTFGFTPTSAGTCQIKNSAPPSQEIQP